jgi:hypothetical protein
MSILLYAAALLLFLYQSLAGHYDPAFTFPVGALLIGAIGAKTLQLYRLNSAAQHGKSWNRTLRYPRIPPSSAAPRRRTRPKPPPRLHHSLS